MKAQRGKTLNMHGTLTTFFAWSILCVHVAGSGAASPRAEGISPEKNDTLVNLPRAHNSIEPDGVQPSPSHGDSGERRAAAADTSNREDRAAENSGAAVDSSRAARPDTTASRPSNEIDSRHIRNFLDVIRFPGNRSSMSVDTGLPVVQLSLKETFDELFINSPDIMTARLDWLANCRKAQASWGAFEPFLTGGYKGSDLHRETSIFLEQTREYDIGVEGKIFSGATYNIGFSLTDIQHSQTSLSRPQAFAGVTLTQPLLKGAWFGTPLAEMRIALLDRNIAFENYRMKLMQTIKEAETAYWNLAFSQEKYRFASESIEIAKKLVEDSKRRVKTGNRSQLDLLEAEAGLASRLADLADCQKELLSAASQLMLLISSDRFSADMLIAGSTELFVSKKEFETLDSLDTLLEKCSAIQPQRLVRFHELAKEEIAVDYYKNQCLPELNVKGSYGYNGFGANGKRAYERLKANAQPTWSSEILLRVPLLLGMEGRNLYSAEKLKKRIAEKKLKAAEYELKTSVNSLHRTTLALREHVVNAQSVVDFRKRLLDVELMRLDAGKSDIHQIYEIEEKLSEAKQWQLESNLKYRTVLLQLKEAAGALLYEQGLEKVENGGPVLSERLLHPEE